MSYSRSFSRRIAVPYKGSKLVSYPASQSGGSISVSFSGTVYEDVEVLVNIDTSPFDSSVKNCNTHVTGLTASVGAMNAAQCLAISENAEKISQTIINGFFNTVRSDLSVQRAELEQSINARLMLLRHQANTLREKQQKMSDDYARTTARYQKIFADLNNELSIRIHEVDQPVFRLVKEVDTQSNRMLQTEMLQTAITMSKESSLLQAQLNVATVKRHALEAMSQVQTFLTSKTLSERAIENANIDGSGQNTYYIPICYMQTVREDKHTKHQCFIPELYVNQEPQLSESLCEQLERLELECQDTLATEQLRSYMQNEIEEQIVGNDRHAQRVKALINKMINQ